MRGAASGRESDVWDARKFPSGNSQRLRLRDIVLTKLSFLSRFTRFPGLYDLLSLRILEAHHCYAKKKDQTGFL